MEPTDWPAVHRIYADGIATGDATLEREAPDWDHFDRSHRHDCRLVARLEPDGPVAGWVALTAYSARRVYSGVAWESVYVAEEQRGKGIGRALLQGLLPVSEAAGFWTLLAGVMVENEASLALHERCGFERVGLMRAMGRDADGQWRDVVLMQRRSRRVGV
jgi:L-amino acid N-acyltransferase YncA